MKSKMEKEVEKEVLDELAKYPIRKIGRFDKVLHERINILSERIDELEHNQKLLLGTLLNNKYVNSDIKRLFR